MATNGFGHGAFSTTHYLHTCLCSMFSPPQVAVSSKTTSAITCFQSSPSLVAMISSNRVTFDKPVPQGEFRGGRQGAICPNGHKEWLPRLIVLHNDHTLIDGKHCTGCYTGDFELNETRKVAHLRRWRLKTALCAKLPPPSNQKFCARPCAYQNFLSISSFVTLLYFSIPFILITRLKYMRVIHHSPCMIR